MNQRKERLPDHPSINSRHYEKYIGKPIKALYDTFFQPHFRDKVAHFFLRESGEILYVSDPEIVDLFESELLIIELSSKVAIENQEYYESLYRSFRTFLCCISVVHKLKISIF